MSALLAWFESRNRREQLILLCGAGVVVLALLATLLLNLHRKVAVAEQRVATKRHDLAWLQTVAPQMSALRGMPARSNESLVVLVDRVARETGIAQSLSGSQSSGNGGLRVRVEKASFDALVAWLGQLSQQYGVNIDSANVDAAAASGVVNATLVLRLP
jgi:general secretion pathway protein M